MKVFLQWCFMFQVRGKIFRFFLINLIICSGFFGGLLYSCKWGVVQAADGLNVNPSENQKGLSLHERFSPAEIAGQSMIVSVSGTSFTSSTKEYLNDIRPGGVILFQSNITSADQLHKFTQDLQNWAASEGLPPLFICIDQEGGIVQRLPFYQVPYSQPQLGAIDDKFTTQDTAQSIIDELARVGINVNLAPVVDVAYLNDSIMIERSFGQSAVKVQKHLNWELDVYNASKSVFPTLKHFPGHGRTSIDSHETVPSINIKLEEWLDSEGMVFRSGIENDAYLIMSGHIRYPAVDDKIASQSEIWLKDILREKMGFRGIIISDDIKMGAVDMENTQAAISFIDAGNDMIIVVLNEEEVKNVHESLKTSYSSQDLFGKKSAFWRFVRIASVKSRLEINLSELNNE